MDTSLRHRLRARWRQLNARRYRAMANLLRHDAPPVDDRRGLVIVQVDGLSYFNLREALASKAMPTLRRLVLDEGWHIVPWLCGLPSSTPSVQAGILYGHRDDIPSFRWFEKDTQQPVDVKAPGAATRVHERVAQGREGLLADGASYCNVLDGGATLAFMTFSAFSRQHFFENARGLDMAFLFLLNPVRALRVGLLTVGDFVGEIADQLADRLRAGSAAPISVVAPFAEALIGIVLQEVQSFGTRIDIQIGRPAIYTNYLGYDKLAHHHGPLHPKALRGLRRIDRHISELIHATRATDSRPFSVIVLSDHGQSPSVSFRERYGQTLGQFIREAIQQDVALHEMVVPESSVAADGALLMEELVGVEAHLSPREQRMVRRLRRSLERQLPPPQWDMERKQDVVVRSSGPVSHVYFNVTPDPLNLSDVVALYPALMARLAAHPGIGVVCGREGGEAAIVGRDGIIRYPWENAFRPGGKLAGLGEPGYAAAQLRRVARYPHSGDLIIMGAWDSRGECVAFEDHVGTHGGISGDQDQGFLLIPPSVPLPPLPVEDAEALYPYFRSLIRPPAPDTQNAAAGQTAEPAASR